MSVRVIDVSSCINVRHLTSVSGTVRNNHELIKAIRVFRDLSDETRVGRVSCALTSASRSQMRQIMPYHTEPIAALCVRRDNVHGGNLVFPSMNNNIELEPGDMCIFKDIDVWQEPIWSINSEYKPTLQLMLFY
jgi:hypothetical protein